LRGNKFNEISDLSAEARKANEFALDQQPMACVGVFEDQVEKTPTEELENA
jgi:hypothetical protein